MTKRTWLILVVVVLIVGAALVYARQWRIEQSDVRTTFHGLPPITYPGFQTWPTPRTFDPPGTAFVQRGDRIQHVANLPGLEPKKVGVESLISAKTSGKWTGGLLAQFLGAPKLSIDSSQDVTVKLEFPPDAERWRIDTQELDEAIKQVKWPPAEEGTAYVVTEEIAINSIKYQVVLSGGAGGKLDTSGLQHTATGTVTVKENDDGSYTLIQDFPEPHYIFYMARMIHKPQGRSAEIRPIPEGQQLTWTTEVIKPQYDSR